MKFLLNVLLLICLNMKFTRTAQRNQKHELDPIWYLNKFGYLKHNASIPSKTSEKLVMLKDKKYFLNNNNKYDDEFRKAIAKFQKFANLNVTGILDEKTIDTMKLPRCGHPDLTDTSNELNSFRRRRYALQGSKWLKHQIRYKISKYPIINSLTKEQIDNEVSRAFELWGTVSELKFEHVRERSSRLNMLFGNQNEPTDIEIKFETGYHGDSEPFDGPGYILGHAYFPQFGGSTHFDAEELWTKKSPEGVNLYQVAVHEFGHALGLEHSDNYDAIMAPFFRGYTEDFVLNPDDITAIQFLYGKSSQQPNTHKDHIYDFNNDWNNHNDQHTTYHVHKQELPVNTPALPPTFSNVNPQPPASLCLDGRFDAITLLQDGYTYVFKGVYVYKFDQNFLLDSSFPKLIRSLFGRWDGMTWISIPDNIDTILFIPDTGKTYFFKEEFYWRTTFYELDPDYPKLISDNFKGLNNAHGFYGKLDASFLWSGNGRVYFIAGDKYWRYDLSLMEVEYGYPKSLALWRGLPMRITDALLWVNGITYFFSDGYYYRFNDLAFKVEEASPAYPRTVVDAWFGCQNRLGNLILDDNNSSQLINKPKSSKLEEFEETIDSGNVVLNLQSDNDRPDEGTLSEDRNGMISKLLHKFNSNTNSCGFNNFNLIITLSSLYFHLLCKLII